MTNWTSLKTVDSDFVFATTHSLRLSDTWSWVSEAVAEKFDTYPDLLDLEEDEDGREFVAESGKRLAEIHNCRMVNAPRALLQMAAE
jgi:hypothetical protein